ncbi:MAG: hypothetical protein SOY70_06000 [Veillonellaceae bacterium]|nr:hypothetical protein [Veillonellaceae bacterium]
MDERDTKRTQVLTEEERRDFKGVTLDENGREDTYNREQEEAEQRTYESSFGLPHVKIITWKSLSWKTKLSLAALAGVAIAVLVLLGSLFFVAALPFLAIILLLFILKSLW